MNRILILLGLVFLLQACTSKQEAEKALQDKKRHELKAKVEGLEKEVANLETLDMVKGNRLVEAYEEYANTFREDSITPYYLFKGADLSIGVRRYHDAIAFYERIYKYYPAFSKRADCVFMQAFVYDEHLNQKGKASDMYDLMVEKFPDHHLSDDAAALKQNLTLSDEELIKLFEEKNKQATASNE